MNGAAASHLPRKRYKKEKWISTETSKKIDDRIERKKLKNHSEEDHDVWKKIMYGSKDSMYHGPRTILG